MSPHSVAQVQTSKVSQGATQMFFLKSGVLQAILLYKMELRNEIKFNMQRFPEIGKRANYQKQKENSMSILLE